MLKTLLFLTVTWFVQGTEFHVEPHTDCPAYGYNLISYENDCTKFYMCTSGVKVMLNCANSTHFSVTLQACVHPSIADCKLPGYSTTARPSNSTTNETIFSTTTTAAVWTTTSVPQTEAPTGCPPHGNNTLIPHEYNCTKFYKCANGTQILLFCAHNTEFSVTLQACVHPSIADCKLPGYSTTARPSNSTTNETIFSTTTTAAVWTTTSVPQTEAPTGCPPHGNNTLIPHEYDCTKFYKCANGTQILLFCSHNTEFSVTLQACVHPSIADCKLPGYSTTARPSNSTTNETIFSTTTTSTVSTTSVPQTEAPTGCPPHGNNTLIPHEYNCTKFYKCANGTQILLFCAHNTEFSVTLQACVHPSIADCKLPGYSTTARPSNSTTNETIFSTTTTAAVSTTTSVPQTEAPTGCPPHGNNTLIPHEYDCTKFYKCANGTQILLFCSHNTEFSVTLQACVHPSIADCKLPGYSTTARPSNSTTNETIFSTTTTAAVSTTTSVPQTEAPTGCPPHGNNTLIPHEYDCTKFYKCANGTQILLFCGHNTEFSVTLEACVHPSEADCYP